MALTRMQSGDSLLDRLGFGGSFFRLFLSAFADPLRTALGPTATAMALGASSAAWATPITYSFSGAVTGGSLGVTLGTPVSGLYTFDSAASDSYSGDSTSSVRYVS